MRKLFIIDGAAGTGKSDILEFVNDKYPSKCNIIKKITTRSKREDDYKPKKKSDLSFVTNDEFAKIVQMAGKNNFYVYSYDKKSYGFYKDELDNSIKLYENTFVIVRSRDIILQLEEDYKYLVDVIPIFIHADRKYVIERLQADEYSKEEIDFRLKRDEIVFRDYIENCNIYKKVLINNSRKEDFHIAVYRLIDEYSDKNEKNNMLRITPTLSFQLIPELVHYKQAILNKFQKYPYEKNVFLMMKFREHNRDFSTFIKEELGRYGYNCVCVRNEKDDNIDNAEWQITNTIYNPIAAIYCCKYGIALFDEPEKNNHFSPNVSYELGIMQYQLKECLILKHSDLESVPFDLIKDIHYAYTKETDFRHILKRWITKINIQ